MMAKFRKRVLEFEVRRGSDGIFVVRTANNEERLYGPDSFARVYEPVDDEGRKLMESEPTDSASRCVRRCCASSDERARALVALLDDWLAEKSSYDEKTWSALRERIESFRSFILFSPLPGKESKPEYEPRWHERNAPWSAIEKKIKELGDQFYRLRQELVQ